jgi:NAD(P)-dependent dehydrogenase (short-subunit alcohol dehydrogenase family)
MAERAVANGMHVAIGDIGVQFLPGALEKLAEPAAASGVRTFAGICDVTEEASVQAFADEVAAAFVRKKLFLFLCFFCC